MVYKWFLTLYRVSYSIGIVGYIIMMATFMGLPIFFGVKPHVWMDLGIMLMFYALYYGVMARDFAGNDSVSILFSGFGNGCVRRKYREQAFVCKLPAVQFTP